MIMVLRLMLLFTIHVNMYMRSLYALLFLSGSLHLYPRYPKSIEAIYKVQGSAAQILISFAAWECRLEQRRGQHVTGRSHSAVYI